MFKALYIDLPEDAYRVRLLSLSESALPDEAVTVRVEYSALNYKDALALTGREPRVVRSFPMVPGIDFAGVVESSRDDRWAPGDRVVLNGWGLGETHWGGLAEKARVRADWLVRLPDSLTTRQAMGIGTAGYTAMLCVLALEDHGLDPSRGEVLVTGASGGVGSVAISLLARLGYSVTASTGRRSEEAYLRTLGAHTVIDREALSQPGRPLQKQQWAAAIDCVGSHTLANVCASIAQDGAVAACGLAQGMDFPATVAPFILRGITLYGINSVTVPLARREQAWARLASDLAPTHLALMLREVPLSDAVAQAEALLAGKVRGRLLVNVRG